MAPRHVTPRDVPSLYTHLDPPDLPAVDLAHPTPLARQRDSLHSLAHTAQLGTAATFLQDTVLQQSHALAVKHRKNLERRKRSRSHSHHDDDDDDDLVLRERGFVHKRRTQNASEAVDQDDETGTPAGGRPGPARASAQERGVRRAKRIRQQLVKPDVHLEDVQLPPDFPSHDLLVSLHSHASHHLSTTHHLVPPLSPSSPSLPPSALAHFDDLAQRATEQEERLAARGTVAQWKAVRATRIRKAGAGRRRGLWADAERGFEGTALVAMGMLAELLVRDAATSPGDLPLPPPAA
ncbi:hypothetical protein DMC30DRAFT_239969 [Rhodotorula diobovata]|uniref:Uncharacterized protein n=1 Tax=Rhodotorula diobovata TaxID=5288 RepID=A0A5C5G6L8_9BASI|nr:hypothetical protein DMC30DRAFT_239969 [Rhodotorula diobovata]